MRYLLVIVFLLGSSLDAEDAPPLFIADFGSNPSDTPYRPEFWQKEGFVDAKFPMFFGDVDSCRTLVDDSHPRANSKKSLKVLYPKWAVGLMEGGAQAVFSIPPREEYYASYWVRFEDGFSWGGRNHGGKLPGLGSAKLSRGGMETDGTNGFAARLMLRDYGAAVLYLYHMDKPGKWGEEFPLRLPDGNQVKFKLGNWYQITSRIRINTEKNADGEVEIWINRRPALKLNGLRFVTNGDLVDTFPFQTFHGGNDYSWGPNDDSIIHFDDFKIGHAKDQ